MFSSTAGRVRGRSWDRGGAMQILACVATLASLSRQASAFTGVPIPNRYISKGGNAPQRPDGGRGMVGLNSGAFRSRSKGWSMCSRVEIVDNGGGMIPLVTGPRRLPPRRVHMGSPGLAGSRDLVYSSASPYPAFPPAKAHLAILSKGRPVVRLMVLLICGLITSVFTGVRGVGAHMARSSAGLGAGTGVLPPLWRVCLWAVLFVGAAAMAGAETAITTMWPWKVKKIAEEEGPGSPFRLLDKDITKFLTAILICTTTATIYSAALVTDMAAQYGGEKMVTVATLWLTGLTLVVGEIIPKALAVSQAERVARIMVPIINTIALIVYPIGKLMEMTSKGMLLMMGIHDSDDSSVSEEELRMIVMGAKVSGALKSEEQEMIDSVLDLQDTMVSDIMRPRVEVVALEASTDISTFVGAVCSTGYSRFPIFEDNIDNIIGMVLAKNLIDYLDAPNSLDSATVADIMDPAYYVPQSMAVWNVLEEMRRRRIHMAIVVDEYGGTAGIVTLEDILEEVIGEIYDEDDIDELVKEESSIFRETDGSFTIDGFAVLDEVVKVLDMHIGVHEAQKFGTVSGFLCHKAGRIPAIGTRIIVFKEVVETNGKPSENGSEVGAWCFTVIEADERRIISVKADPVMPSIPAVSSSRFEVQEPTPLLPADVKSLE